MYSFSHIVSLIASLIFLPVTQSVNITQCNRVIIDNVAIPTDICYAHKTYRYMKYSCAGQILYRYPGSNASNPCGTEPIPTPIYTNAKWVCGGITCGWVDDIQCDKPKQRAITAKTLDYCMGYSGSDLPTSYSYHCCTDGKTVVQKNWLSSADCESSNTKHLLSHFTFNATCLPNTDRSSGSIYNVTQRVGYVKCNPNAMVKCAGISPMSTTNPPKTTTTMKPKTTTTKHPNTTSTSTPKTTTTPRKTTSANSSTTSQPSKSPSFTTTRNSSGTTMSPSQKTTMKPSTTTSSTSSTTSTSTNSTTSTSMTSTSTMSTSTKSTMNPNSTNSSVMPSSSPTMFPTTNSSSSPNSVGNNKPKGDLIWIIVLIIVAVMCLCCAGAYWFGTKKPEGTSLQGGDASRPLTRGSLEYDDQEIQYVH